MSTKENSDQSRDMANAKHGMYLAMKDAGVLVNGRMTPRGFREKDKKKEDNKTACRKDYS